ncbi:hypothetical protein PM082_022164 [Marasmius tenuissimus]|nr:hypothetical protein PM082_022164 [Marasmius tenuissimus]
MFEADTVHGVSVQSMVSGTTKMDWDRLYSGFCLFGGCFLGEGKAHSRVVVGVWKVFDGASEMFDVDREVFGVDWEHCQRRTNTDHDPVSQNQTLTSTVVKSNFHHLHHGQSHWFLRLETLQSTRILYAVCLTQYWHWKVCEGVGAGSIHGIIDEDNGGGVGSSSDDGSSGDGLGGDDTGGSSGPGIFKIQLEI